MRIVCLADTHELHREISVPNGDLLIHAGDFSFFAGRESVLWDFHRWLGELPHKYKIVVPGNHDVAMLDPHRRVRFRNATLLIDCAMEVGGLRLWGSPLTPLRSGAFTEPDCGRRQRHWARVPNVIDVLITHGPALGILDAEPGSDEHEGCPELLDAVRRIQPRIHIFGHVHHGFGSLQVGATLHVNAALFTEWGDVDRQPITIDMDDKHIRRVF